MASRPTAGNEPHAAGRVVGTSLRPRALEAEFRAAHLREDGRDAAVVIGSFTLLSLVFVPNDLLWAAPAARLLDTEMARAAYMASGLVAVVVGLRTRRPAWLDWSILASVLVGAAFTVVLQSTRPRDYYLPMLVNAVWTLIAWSVVPNRFAFQALAAAGVTGAGVAWLVAFRTPPPRPALLLIATMLFTANMAGAFLSWRLHRYRRFQFLAVREQAETASRLARTSRLAALGTLVAGVAHEVNNPLSAAMASNGFAAEELHVLRESLASGPPPDPRWLASRLDAAREALEDAQTGERRIAAIVRDMTLLGRTDVPRSRVALARAVRLALEQVPAALRSRADVQVEDLGAPDVAASEGQVVQVLVNLITNAVHAAPRDRTVAVVVRLARGAPGTSRVEVIDDGVGMSEQTLARMFDPFFSTRGVGQGTGLGLAVCHAIVTAYGGAISATSGVGAGSCVRLELPAVPET